MLPVYRSVRGVEVIIAHRLGDSTVILVAARLRDGIDVNAKVVAVLRRVSSGLHADFLYGIRIWRKILGGMQGVHDGHAVQCNVILFAASTGACEGFARGVAHGYVPVLQNAGRRESQFENIVASHRKRGDGCLVQGLSQRGIVSGDWRRCAGTVISWEVALATEVCTHRLIDLNGAVSMRHFHRKPAASTAMV